MTRERRPSRDEPPPSSEEKGNFAPAIGLLGPTNLTDFTPAVTIVLRGTLAVGFEYPNSWRSSTGDGVYGIDLRVLIRPKVGSGH